MRTVSGSAKRTLARLHLLWLLGGSRPCHRPARPSPLEVESTEPPFDVEDLAAEKESGATSRLERARVHLVERHAAGGDLGLLVAERPVDAQRPRHEQLDELAAPLARNLARLQRRADAGLGAKRDDEPIGQPLAEMPPHGEP